jgi:exodeoxyribonuclease VII large subunit
LNARLESVNPMAVLSRGYGLVRLASGAVVTRAAQVAPGDVLATRMQDGEIASVVACGARRKRSVKSEPRYDQPSLL